MFSSLPTRHPTKIVKPDNWHFGRDHGTLIQPPSRPNPPTPITDRNKKITCLITDWTTENQPLKTGR